MTLDYNAVTAVATALAAFAAVIALLYDNQRSRFALGVETLLKLDDKFDGATIKAARRKAAQSLLKNSNEGLDDILDFFEMVGLLTRRGAIDAVLVCDLFFDWIHCYWTLAKEYVDAIRVKENPTIWLEAEWLHTRLVEIEKRKSKCSTSDLALSEEDGREFLDAESKIDL